MFVEFLSVNNFRNLQSTEIYPHKGLNLFLGNNAQGKTSLLESLYVTTNLKSFRTKNISDCIQFNQEAFVINTTVNQKNNIKNFIQLKYAHAKKELLIDEKPATKTKLIKTIKAVEFSPESLSIIKHGPELRRDLVDDAAALFFEEAVLAQSSYQKVLKQKNATLMRFKREEISFKTAQDLLESLEPMFLTSATDVSYLRLKTMEALLPTMAIILSQIIKQEVSIKAQYNITENTYINTAQYNETQRLVLESMKDLKNTQKERVLGVSCAGPHKHTLNILYDGKNSRFFSSQGQQRALILAFKIAQIVYHEQTLGTHPILLLDDVLSEFDESKQKYLLDFLQNSSTQTFLTSTNYAQKIQSAKIFTLDSGKVRTNGT